MFLRVTGASAGVGGEGGMLVFGVLFFVFFNPVCCDKAIQRYNSLCESSHKVHAAVTHIKEINGINSMIMHQLHYIR